MTTNETTNHVPFIAQAVAAPIIEAGFQAFIVGGFVRDTVFFNAEANDIDIATNATIEQIEAIFPGQTRDTGGKKFGIIRVIVAHQAIEVATFRGETIEADMTARDITINAVAMNCETGEIVAHPQAFEDMQNGVIRFCQGFSTIVADPMRAVRAVRFAVRFGFVIDTDSQNDIRNAVETGVTDRINPEAFKQERAKMKKTGRGDFAFDMMKDFGFRWW